MIWTGAAILTVLSVGAYELVLWFPSMLGTKSAIWLGFGVLAAAGVFYLSSVDEQLLIRAVAVGTAGVVWWSCWGIFTAETVPLPAQPFSDDVECACHMKEIAWSIGLFQKHDRDSEVVFRRSLH